MNGSQRKVFRNIGLQIHMCVIRKSFNSMLAVASCFSHLQKSRFIYSCLLLKGQIGLDKFSQILARLCRCPPCDMHSYSATLCPGCPTTPIRSLTPWLTSAMWALRWTAAPNINHNVFYSLPVRAIDCRHHTQRFLCCSHDWHPFTRLPDGTWSRWRTAMAYDHWRQSVVLPVSPTQGNVTDKPKSDFDWTLTGCKQLWWALFKVESIL